MPTYKVKDTATGKTVSLTGDSPPTEAELEEIFTAVQDDPQKLGLGARAITAAAVPATLLAPELADRIGRSFLGIKQPGPEGAVETVADYLGREGLQTGLSTGAQLLAGGVGPQAAAAAGVGAGAGTAIQEGARALAKRVGYDADAPGSVGEALGESGKSAASVAAASYVVPKALQKVPDVFDYLATSKIGGGIAKPAWEYFKKNTKAVLDQIGATPEAADAIANDLRASIANASQKLEDLYRAGVTKLEQSKTPIKINLEKNLGDVFRHIAKGAGYMDPKRNADTEEAAFFFKNIINRVRDLKGATPLQIYELQKDLNRHIKDKIGTSLGSDLLAAKDALRLFIEDHPQLRSIADMNAAWHESKIIETTAKKFTGNNDLVAYMRRAFSNVQDTLQKRGIERVAALVPEVGEQVGKLRAHGAAQAVQPMVRGMTGTGFETAPGILGTIAYALKNPLWGAAALPLSPLISPRLYAVTQAARLPQRVAEMASTPTIRAIIAAGANLANDQTLSGRRAAR